MGWGAAKCCRATSGCSSPPAVPLVFHRDNWGWLTGDGGLGNSQLIAREALKLSKRAGNTMGSSAEKQSNFRSPPWPASLVGRKFLRLFFSPVPRALHITKHYGKNHNQTRKALRKDSKLVHHNEYMMMPFLSFKNSIAIRLWSRSFSWKLL